jgi:hypothetical protein
MELSSKTLTVLKNYATINPNFVFKHGDSISTMSEAKNILSMHKLSEPFDKEIGIYDLPEFLSAIDLVDSPRFKFEDDYVTIGDSTGLSNIKYYYSSAEMLTHPNEKLLENAQNMGNPVVTFQLDHETLSKLKKAASAFGHSDLVVTKSEAGIKLTVSDVENNTSNNYSIDVPGDVTTEEPILVLNINNLKIIPGDYAVSILDKMFAHISNDNIQYWIACEKSKSKI